MPTGELSLPQIIAQGLSGQPVHNQEAQGIIGAVEKGTHATLPIESKQALVDAAYSIAFSEGPTSPTQAALANAIISIYGGDEK